MNKNKVFAAALIFYMSLPTAAGVPAEEAKRLVGDLTPYGAERKGNGNEIPDWNGGITKKDIPLEFKTPRQHLPDPFPDDKSIFIISAENVSTYTDKLPEGFKALFETYPETFKMHVYKTRRTHSVPEWVNQNVARNAVTAKLTATGLENAYGGIPFPVLHGTKNEMALQAIWNHILRYRGKHVTREASEVAVQRNGKYSLITLHQEADFMFYDQKGSWETLDNSIFKYISFTMSPARLAGSVVLVHETLDQKLQRRQAWGYNAGQRRVRRAPELAYYTPVANADALRTADDTDMYNGAPDRYNWTMIGKKEMYIPYNNFRVDSPDLKYKNLLTPGHLNPEHLRYELHRVWVIEANLIDGKRHIYSKRRFYIDEDSWQVAAIDQYDSSGKLWRVSTAYIKNFYNVPTTWAALDVFHDLRSRRYHVQNLDNEEEFTAEFSMEDPEEGYFTPASLRRLGRR